MASTSIPTHSDGEAAIPGAAADGLRAGLHGLWSAVAGGWAEYADEVDVRGRPVTDAMLAATAPWAGERVLELACGPGGTGLAAAALVAPGGEVVLSDVAAEMTAIAAARAAEAGVPNVTTRVLDLELIDEPDGAYDVVLCREGLMFALEPAVAVGEIARVLRPGGRLAIMVPTAGRTARLWEMMPNVGAHAFGDDEIGDILEDNGFASVRVNTFGTFQWVRGKNG
jgi:SAM-dependent methyltransferase